MRFAYTPYVLPLLAAAGVSIWAFFYIWKRRETQGATLLSFLAASVTFWSLGYALEIAGADLPTKLFWGKMQYFGITSIPIAWLLFAAAYAGSPFPLRRGFIAGLSVIPLVTLGLALTTERHGLIWSDFRVFRAGSFSALEITHGLWFWVYWAYSQLLILLGTALIARMLLQERGAFRGQKALLLVAALTPWIGNVLSITGGSVLDLTPFGFTVSVAVLVWAISGFRLIDLAPLARGNLMDFMSDGLIVFDARGVIVDINSAAARMIGTPAARAVGKSAEEVLAPWADVALRFRHQTQGRAEVFAGEGEARRRYEMNLSALQDSRGELVGRMVTLRSLDADVPQPRFARAAQESVTLPAQQTQPQGEGGRAEPAPSFWRRIADFYVPSLKRDLPVPPNVNPAWSQAREQILTLGARVGATIGLLALLFAPSGSANLFFGALVALLAALGLGRNLPYSWRIAAFLALIYAAALNETLHFGFSVESFVFFLSLTLAGAALSTRRGALYAFLLTIGTMLVFSFLIGGGYFEPLTKNVGYLPADVASGVSSLAVFAASAVALSAAVVTLTRSLNRAWEQETQALNLLQQERDLLEQRVQERSREVFEAEKKYRTLVEQLPVAIYRDDADGKGTNNYFSPQIEGMLGYSLSEWEANPALWRDILYPEDRKRALATVEETLKRGRSVSEYRLIARDGRAVWMRDEAQLARDEEGAPLFVQGVLLDITEIRRAEEEIHRLSQAVEQSGNTIIITDTTGAIEYVNPQFERSSGYSFAEVKGKTPRILKSGRQPPESYRDLWQTISAGLIWKGEFLNRRKDGSLYWESAMIAPILDSNGAVKNYVAVKEDITERKILQEQLQRQNDYLSVLHQMTLDLLNRRGVNNLLQTAAERAAALLDSPYCALALLEGEELVFRAATAAAGKIQGLRIFREADAALWRAMETGEPLILDSEDEEKSRPHAYAALALIALAVFPIVAGEQRLGALLVGRAEQSQPFSREQVETGLLFARLAALALDNARLYESAMRELDERKRAEALLQVSETRFRQIVESASDIIYGMDVEGRLTYANPAALKLMGYEREEEAIGKSFFDFIAPESRAEVESAYRLQTEAPKHGSAEALNAYSEFYFIAAGGQMKWLGQNAQVIMEGSRAVGFQAVARDITALKQAQEALALSRDQALEASRFKSQLLSRVSHELRTPLGGILGYAELMQYSSFGTLTEKQQKAVSNIIESAHYLTNIVNDLLDEAQMQSKSLMLFEDYFHPRELMDAVSATVSALAARKGLRYSVEIFPDLPEKLYGDAKRLRQIIVNLAGNAVKFSREGEVRVSLRRLSPAQWQIAVSDSGVGIPLEEQQNIFAPFRQVNNAITRENRGSGLGLAITKQLTDLMGGEISLTSEPGKGSVFVVTLPIKDALPEKA